MPFRRRLILAIHAFVGLGALAPGWLLMQDPSGAGLGMRAEWIAAAPFADYRLPGAVLFGVIGLGNLGLIALNLRRPQASAPGAQAMGVFLMAWIGFQLLWLEPRSWLQALILGLGVGLLWLGWEKER